MHALGALMGIKLRDWLFPRAQSPDEFDREADEFRQAWRGRRLRALLRPLAVASSEMMDPELGADFVARGISLVPSQHEATLFYPLDQRCPLCGGPTSLDTRRSIWVHFTF